MILANVPAFYYGTSPNKFFDYLASGLPVICNYPGWVSDLITEHQCGIAVAPSDAGAFADALQALASDPVRRQTMGMNARALAKRFDREVLAEQFVDTLEQVA
jgi:glycosyltransferase involved in cell wall biosynthesis